MGSASRRRGRSLLAATGLTAAGVTLFLGLAQLLPEPIAERPQAAAPAAPAAADADCAHEGEAGHSCGLDAKAMLARFQAAIRDKGAIHRTVPWEGGGLSALAVADQVLVQVEGADLAGLTARHGLRLLRREQAPGLVLLGTTPGASLPGLLEALRQEPGVRFAEPNLAARVALVPNDPFLRLMRGRRYASLESAWDLTTGDPNVLVAVLDTGVDPAHPDLRNRLVPGFDFVNQTAVMSDDNGHGTAMAGIVGAEGRNAEGVVGVAFDGRILPVKVADAQGVASVADVVAGIDFAIQRRARVINLSLGVAVGTQALKDAVDRALAAGIVVVAAAGNDPVHHEMYPAAYPGVVSTTVLGPQGELGFEAVVADGVEVGGPGEDLITTLPGDVYGFVSGSSAAAAYASGVAALVAARTPALTGDQIRQVLAEARRAVPALAGLETTYRFGLLDARLALDRADPTYLDAAVTDLRCYPARPQPGQATVAVAEVSNEGLTALTNLPVRVQRILPTGQRIELGLAVVTLQPGQRTEVQIPFTAPAAGAHDLRGVASTLPGEREPADNEHPLLLTVAPGPAPDLRIVGRSITPPDVTSGAVTVSVVVENRGTDPAANVTVDATVQAVHSLRPPGMPVIPPSFSLGRQVVAQLAVGQRATLNFTWPVAPPAPRELQRITTTVAALPGETNLEDNQALFDIRLGAPGPLGLLYQQSNGVDLIPDAPARVDPLRSYVPVQVFVPSKGGRDPATKLRITRTELKVRDAAAGSGGTAIYVDTHGAPPSATVPGLELTDEMGQPRQGAHAADMFGEDELDMNGRYTILRVPRDALGVPPAPAQPVTRFLDVKVDWEQRRVLLWVFQSTRRGSHRAVLRVRFASESFPSLPGENHYHDVHHHTIAEWYFGSALDLFAPRKAYGGPLPMVFEAAYAMGVIDAPDARSAWGKIITTDHSSFNNRTIPDPDGPDHRPPFGPQSAAVNAPGLTQLDAYRSVLGPTAGEEVAFKQDIPMPKINPVVNNLLNMLPGLPLGAHMLLYGADHVEGPWHGGGWLKGPGNPNIDVNLFPLLNDVAKARQSNQADSFAYAAHPFGGQGWNDSNLNRAFGLDPTQRTDDEVHDGSKEFVVKGVEFFNGRGTRSLPTSQIDFNDLNPWADPVFQAGEQDWDKSLWVGMTEWHQMIARTLEYSLQSQPDVRFVRKIYQAGGSDAHGDFNFSVGRAATPISLQMTYNVGDETWYGVRTYCFGDGKAAGTPEARWLEAYRDGNSVTTDGPLATFSLDADPRFDSSALRWDDAATTARDDDGRIGGDGPFDGGYTALVRRGATEPVFRYRYSSSDEYGPVASLLLYKTEAGAPNPTRARPKGGLLGGNYDQIVGVNELALGGADTWLEQRLDPAKEGPVTKLTAFALGAYTGGNPDQIDLGPDNFRCWTNPIYCAPYDVDVDVTAIDASTGTIPAGALQVRFTFDVSMDPGSYAIELKGLDAQGSSTDGATAGFTVLQPASGSGWADRPGIRSSVLTVVNRDAIPLGGDAYPASDRASFVVYWRDAPRDAAGNALNRIGTTFSAQRYPGAGAATTTAPATGSTASGATPGGSGTGSTTPVAAGGRSGGSGCALSAPTGPRSPLSAALLGLLLVGLVRRRRAA